MAEETKFNQDKYVVLQDKSKEEILSDKELTELWTGGIIEGSIYRKSI